MTTFDAVTAHWPKQGRPRSTQKSRKSVKASSPAQQSSPASNPVKGEPSSPANAATSPGHAAGRARDYRKGAHPADLDADSDDEENPFEALAMTQRAPDDVPEVNPSFISRNVQPAGEGEEDEGDDDDPDRFRRLHEQDAAKHAEESARFRATQVPKRDQDEMSEYDDEELDELFRQTVTGGFSTPTKNRAWNSNNGTPTSVGTSGSSLGSRRAQRDQRLREQAGLGDLR